MTWTAILGRISLELTNFFQPINTVLSLFTCGYAEYWLLVEDVRLWTPVIGHYASTHLDLFTMVRFSLQIKTCCLCIVWEKQDQIWANIFCISKNRHSRTPMDTAHNFAAVIISFHIRQYTILLCLAWQNSKKLGFTLFSLHYHESWKATVVCDLVCFY